MLRTIVVAVIANCGLLASELRAAVIPPSGLAPGSQYQLIFVTNEGMTATSPDINAYNAFVTAEAALNPSLPSGVTWNAVISTPTVNADTNAVSVAGLPTYNTQGIEVASGATGLYTPSLLAPVEYNQYGDLPNTQGLPVYAWTGSDTSGDGLPGGQAGNSSGAAWAGYVYSSDSQWMDYVYLAQDADPPGYHSFYALSSAITVPALNTPEPGTMTLLCAAFAVVAGARRIGRRHQSRRDSVCCPGSK
jgi:hypothetical protein